jgi:hypothetical protein
MSVKTTLIAAALLVGATSFALAQAPATGQGQGTGAGPAGGGIGTVSGKPDKAQNNNRGPGKNATAHTRMMKHHARRHRHHMKKSSKKMS